ncbi:MAG: hypothetical protein LQ343_003624 [Gyalolechia ehrenbergii]|nr:MAG: hypothetical protein LQ343_003624 [Gyalolechia ehrenbergii]
MAGSPPIQPPKPKPRRKAAGRADGGYKIAGTILPWDPDIDLDRPTPTPLFPSYKPTPPAPLSNAEKAQVAAFRSLRARIHEGPFYTTLDNDARVGKNKTVKASAATFDPFEGMPTYSQKYMKKRRRLPKLSARPYVLKYFPKELWPTLDPKNHKPSSNTTSTTINGVHKRVSETAKRKDVQETAGEASGDEDEGATVERDPDEEAMDEPMDDNFDEDEDDGGDYNAEQYFDDGGDDLGDDLDGGEADGGDYY